MSPIRPKRKPAPLGGCIDVYKCLLCGDTLAVNADGQTFGTSPPLECQGCPGQPDMQAGRYYSTVTVSSALRVSSGVDR